MSTCRRLTGRTAIVTASTSGIGFAVAKRFAEEGAKVILSSRKKENVERSVKVLTDQGFEAKGVVCHVFNDQQRKALFDTARNWGGLDILVSHAGISPVIKQILDTDQETWDRIFDLNVKSGFLLAKEALPLLKKSRFGRIIFTSSVKAYNTLDFAGAYSVSKTALIGLTKAVALQAAQDNITVNSVAPGTVKTKFSRLVRDKELVEEEVLDKVPLTRIGTPEEIAGVFAFLASDDAAYITGETIVVAGGVQSRL